MAQILIILNPHAGDKSSRTVGKSTQNIFKMKDMSTKIYQTTGKDDFETLIRKEMDLGLNIVVVLGGDGTVSEVVDGIARLEKRPKVLPLPLGTTNNFVRALGMELNDENLLELIEKNQIEEIEVDIGKVNNQYFISTVSAGSIPEVAWQTDDDLKENIGSMAYILEGMKSLNDFDAFDIQINTDNETHKLTGAYLVVIGLTNSIFGIPTFFKDASFDDGKLYLYVLKKTNLINEASSVARHIIVGNNKENTEDEHSLVTSFKKGSIVTSNPMNSVVDGEKGPHFPLELSILHKHITFLVPKVK